MKELLRALKGHKALCFLDLEGTQISHEIIEIGAYKVILKDDGSIKKIHRPYKAYVKPKHRIGPFVTKLTGINEKTIQKEGVPYREMQKSLVKYMGKDWDRALFIAYGTQDGQMFITSAENNMDSSMEIARHVYHHTFDFCGFLSTYVKGEDGNCVSLSRACEIFGISFEGQAHDALSDAYNMLQLFIAIQEKRDILKAEYEKVLARNGKYPTVIRSLLQNLLAGKTVTPKDFDALMEESLK